MARKLLLDSKAVEKGEMIVVMAGRLSGLGLSSSVTLFTVGGTSRNFVETDTDSGCGCGDCSGSRLLSAQHFVDRVFQ